MFITIFISCIILFTLMFVFDFLHETVMAEVCFALGFLCALYCVFSIEISAPGVTINPQITHHYPNVKG